MRRPAAVTVFGILNIGFGILRILSAPVLILALVYRDSWLQYLPPGNPATERYREIMQSPDFIISTYISSGLGIVASLILLVSGIGLLKLRPWARYAAIGCGVYGCFETTVSTIISYYLVYLPMLDEGASDAVVGGMVGDLVGAPVSLLYPALLIIFMFMPSVKASFEPGWGESPPLPGTDSKQF
jgi:hypothetical protein